MYKFYYKALFVTLSMQAPYISSNILLQAPATITLEGVQQKQENETSSFCWTTEKDCCFKFRFSCGTTCGTMQLTEHIFNQLQEEDKQKFHQCSSEETALWRYDWGIKTINQRAQEIQKPTGNYYFAQPRIVVSSAHPQRFDSITLADIIKHKRIIFYTGAGISAAANVKLMVELEASLGIVKQSALACAHNLLQKDQQVLDTFTAFCKAAFEQPPTAAHYALKKLALYKSTQIITENFDLLQHRTGIVPLFIDAPTYSPQITPQDLQEIDAIICLGLSYDYRGFLNLYKTHNPQGTLIAINFKTPLYLDSNDFIIEGDLQKLIIEIVEQLKLQ